MDQVTCVAIAAATASAAYTSECAEVISAFARFAKGTIAEYQSSLNERLASSFANYAKNTLADLQTRRYTLDNDSVIRCATCVAGAAEMAHKLRIGTDIAINAAASVK